MAQKLIFFAMLSRVVIALVLLTAVALASMNSFIIESDSVLGCVLL